MERIIDNVECPYCGASVTDQMRETFHKTCVDSEARLDRMPKTIWFRCRSCQRMMGSYVEVRYVIDKFKLIMQGSGPEW